MSSKWTDEKIKNGILSVMKENGMKAMPTASAIRAATGSYALSTAIQKTGGFAAWAARLNVEMTRCDTRFGQFFEEMCCGYLTNCGYECERMPVKYPYDILADGVKIDVKSSTPFSTSNGKYYTFNLEKPFPTCDVYVAYCVTKEKEIKKTYLIPSCRLQGKTQLSIGENRSRYDCYLDAWSVVDGFRDFVRATKYSFETPWEPESPWQSGKTV